MQDRRAFPEFSWFGVSSDNVLLLVIYWSLSPNDILVGFAIFTQFAQYITRVTKTHSHTQTHGVLFTPDLALEKQLSYIRQRQVFLSVVSDATCEAFTRP